MKKRRLGNQRGVVFVATVVSMFMMVLVGGSIYSFTNHGSHFFNRLKKSTQAKYLAEAGLAHALANLNSSFTTSTTYPLTNLSPGTYQAAVTTPVSGRTLVSSTGTVQGVSRTVTAEVSGPTLSALNYLLCGGGNIDLRLTAWSTCSLAGDIYSVGDVDMRAIAAGASINIFAPGNVYAGGGISSSGNVSYGSLNPGYTSVVGFPVMDFNWYKNIAQTNGYFYSANKTYTAASPIPASPAGGVIFVNGNITISGAQNTTACIVATGNITITQATTTINQYLAYPAMLTENGSIIIRSVGAAAQGALVATGLVYSGNNFELSGNHNSANVTGSIIARGTLGETGTHCSLTETYVAQNPPGMISNGGQPMTVESYNK